MHLLKTHRDVSALGSEQQPDSSRQVVILQWRDVIVCDSQRVRSLDEEVIVQAPMLIVVHCS